MSLGEDEQYLKKIILFLHFLSSLGVLRDSLRIVSTFRKLELGLLPSTFWKLRHLICLFGCCWGFEICISLDFVVCERRKSPWISPLYLRLNSFSDALMPAGKFSANERARSSDGFVASITSPTFLTQAVRLKSGFANYLEISAYILIAGPGRWSFLSKSEPRAVKWSLLKYTFHLLSFIQQSH